VLPKERKNNVYLKKLSETALAPTAVAVDAVSPGPGMRKGLKQHLDKVSYACAL
jgi:hypothetical protein